jgi:hypothetical protein
MRQFSKGSQISLYSILLDEIGSNSSDAEQHLGKHYDLHSMFGWSETEPTLRYCTVLSIFLMVTVLKSLGTGSVSNYRQSEYVNMHVMFFIWSLP